MRWELDKDLSGVRYFIFIFFVYFFLKNFEKEYVYRYEGRDISFSENVLKVKSVCICIYVFKKFECNFYMYKRYFR